MIVSNVKRADSEQVLHLEISGGHIRKIAEAPFTNSATPCFTFENAIIFPGLINSHDHLDFNLFPALGDRHYRNYTEWGKYIHETFPDEIARVLKIPVGLREQWGVYKNLLCGVTTVANHGQKATIADPQIRILGHCQNLHSVRFEKNWKLKLNNPLKAHIPVAMHVGEGADADAHEEIDELVRWNLLGRKLIGVHGVAMSEMQARSFEALAWCPESNYFLLNKTAQIAELKQHTSILFGSDSTLTGGWNIWEHIRLARKTGLLTDAELYDTLTVNAAKIWQTGNSRIEHGAAADLVVARAKNGSGGWDGFYSVGPDDILLVIQNGKVRLCDEACYKALKTCDSAEFSPVNVGNQIKYVAGDIQKLMAETRRFHPDAVFPIPAKTIPAI